MNVTEAPQREYITLDLLAQDVAKLRNGERLTLNEPVRHREVIVLPPFEEKALIDQFEKWGYSRATYQPGMISYFVKRGFAVPYEGGCFSPQDELLNGGTQRTIEVHLPRYVVEALRAEENHITVPSLAELRPMNGKPSIPLIYRADDPDEPLVHPSHKR